MSGISLVSVDLLGVISGIEFDPSKLLVRGTLF
jgi:hypothetical protein